MWCVCVPGNRTTSPAVSICRRWCHPMTDELFRLVGLVDCWWTMPRRFDPSFSVFPSSSFSPSLQKWHWPAMPPLIRDWLFFLSNESNYHPSRQQPNNIDTDLYTCWYSWYSYHLIGQQLHPARGCIIFQENPALKMIRRRKTFGRIVIGLWSSASLISSAVWCCPVFLPCNIPTHTHKNSLRYT